MQVAGAANHDNMTPTIRGCTEDDLDALQAMACETYDDTFRKLNEARAQTDINDPESLRRQYSGRGFGIRLMQFALDLACRQQKRYSWLDVWEKNEKTGRHALQMGDEMQTDYIMKKTTAEQALECPKPACGFTGNER